MKPENADLDLNSRTNGHGDSPQDAVIRWKLKFLEARDHAIGASAELGEMRYRLEIAQAEIDSLVNQLEILHSSRTWRAGRVVLLPLRIIRRILTILTN